LADFVKIKNPKQQNRQDLFFGPKTGKEEKAKKDEDIVRPIQK
jgi:hypothetical protein